MRHRFLAVLFSLAAAVGASGQLAGTPEIKVALKRLNTVGSVLMIAAHPDDESTALIAYFARGKSVRTAYLSLTRGEGGQNLIGAEQGDLLGVIRTQELLASRRIDGGEQFFSRAIDFGFSKTADETFAKWGREKILGDVVWAIRSYRPDVVILQFSGTPRDGHGQHQASAILGKEAYTAAADPAQFPEQLKFAQPWHAKRLLWNYRVFGRDAGTGTPPNHVVVDTGAFDPVLGHSYSEIAGMSRSMNRSQGEGSPQQRGTQKQYLVNIGGDAAATDVFDGIDVTWKRIPGGEPVGELIGDAIRKFEPEHPEGIVPQLLKGRAIAAGLKLTQFDGKLKEFDDAIALCASLWLDASTDRPSAVPGSKVAIKATAVNRSPLAVSLAGVRLGEDASADPPAELPYNQPVIRNLNWSVPESAPYSQPFWLRLPKDGDTYRIERQSDVNLAEYPPVMHVRYDLVVSGVPVSVRRPVRYRYLDRERGETIRPFDIVPPVVLQLPAHAFLFPSRAARNVEIEVRANIAGPSGSVRLEMPSGWTVEPRAQDFHLTDADEQKVLSFQVTPPPAEARGVVRAVATLDGREVSVGMDSIHYEHITPQAVFPRASAGLVRADVKVNAKRIGYVMGAGDDVAKALRQIGVEVLLLGSEELARGDLSHYDAIVTGVRAFNVRSDLRANLQRLLDYVSNGGTMIVQYNRPEPMVSRVGPYPLTPANLRVTVEEAPMTFAHPDSPLLNAPNKITDRDFDGWVQERGLYFASQWDGHYEPLFESHDPGEKPLPGGNLVTKYGKGTYIFTGYAWFRQLPAGVPGAFRIFANFLSAGKQ